MLGLINDCTEQLVITKFGLDAWHTIKENAKCDVKDYGFISHGHYPDSATVDIVVAAAALLKVGVDDVLELFGHFFLQYTIEKGYDNLLRCQGSNLRLWLSNLNAMHAHLQSAMPAGNFPVFWCENCITHEGTIILHYYSIRGPLLSGVVVGIVKEVAKVYFDVEIDMDKLAVQDENADQQCTTWRISSIDPAMSYKLTTDKGKKAKKCAMTGLDAIHRMSNQDDDMSATTASSFSSMPMTCPFTGACCSPTGRDSSGITLTSLYEEEKLECPFVGGGGNDALSRCVSKQDQTSTRSLNVTSDEAMYIKEKLECPFGGGGNDASSRGLSKQDQTSTRSLNVTSDEAKMLMGKLIKRTNSTENLKRIAESMNGGGGTSSGGSGSDVVLDCVGSIPASPTPKGKKKAAISSRKLKKKAKNAALVSKISMEYTNGLPSSMVCSIFPYHVMVDVNFMIVQVGYALPEILMRDEEELVGQSIGDVFKIVKPILGGWDWPTLQRLADQKFFLTPLGFHDVKTGAEVEYTNSGIKFKGNMVQISTKQAMFVLSPDADNITELTTMGLTLSDLPLHSFQRDVVFLGEHIASEVRTAHKLDKLSKRLEKEKNLSDTLLNSMLPRSVAESMRAGEAVEPLLYENVTLFFSDIVGFTRICDQVEPRDVIDMLNQLYYVMDHLASHFNLYKVETIGDAYMCCSGLPTPTEQHAQNVANFALAVRECVHLVESPVDRKPLKLRIGIHTGHCMGGVVGTLAPHYCLFGDMVNTTARHESTGMEGKIQCSSVLHEHLAEYSADSKGPMYNFTPRGYVDMKGKGQCYTYWLDGGSEYNGLAGPTVISELRKQVKQLLRQKKWKELKIFKFARRASNASTLGPASACSHDLGSITTESTTTNRDDTIESFALDELVGKTETDAPTSSMSDKFFNGVDVDVPVDDGDDDDLSNHDTVSFIALKKTAWSHIKWSPDLSRKDLVDAIHGLLSSMLWKCSDDVIQSRSDVPTHKEFLDQELLRFVDRISTLYNDCPFHSWTHACQVTLSATFLVKEYHKTKDEFGGSFDSHPFVRFTAVFAALIHDVKHLGVPNAQLKEEGHPLSEVYYQGSYLERQSIQVGLGIFMEEFTELSTTVLELCPEFIHLVTSAILATDISNKETERKVQERFDRVIVATGKDYAVTELDKTQSVVEHILLLADVGHCSQGYDNFLIWNAAFFHERFQGFQAGRGSDPRQEEWHQGQIGFIEGYIIPLAVRCNTLIPQCKFSKGSRRIVRKWKIDGKDYCDKLVEHSIEAEKVTTTTTSSSTTTKKNRKRSSGIRKMFFPSRKSLSDGYVTPPKISNSRLRQAKASL